MKKHCQGIKSRKCSGEEKKVAFLRFSLLLKTGMWVRNESQLSYPLPSVPSPKSHKVDIQAIIVEWTKECWAQTIGRHVKLHFRDTKERCRWEGVLSHHQEGWSLGLNLLNLGVLRSSVVTESARRDTRSPLRLGQDADGASPGLLATVSLPVPSHHPGRDPQHCVKGLAEFSFWACWPVTKQSESRDPVDLSSYHEASSADMSTLLSLWTDSIIKWLLSYTIKWLFIRKSIIRTDLPPSKDISSSDFS